MTPRTWTWLMTVILCCMSPLSLRAHTLSVSHLDVSLPDDEGPLSVQLDLALRDIALTMRLDANGDDVVTWGELKDVRTELEQAIVSGLAFSTQGGPCPLTPVGLATRRYGDGTYASLSFEARCPAGSELELRYSLLMAEDPQHRSLVTLHSGQDVATAIARAGATRITIDTQQLADHSGFLAFLREGVHHILIGYDHLAFLISMLIPAAYLRVQGSWEVRPSFASSARSALGIVTAFTVAHSITLSLAALGWVTPASNWVEIAIALSVLLVALNNLRPILTQRLWVAALAFGLIHGFGFAGALSELSLPADSRLTALVAFNLGVELGQLAVVAVVLPVFFALRNQDWYVKWAMPAASVAVAAAASWWIYVRTFPT